MAEALDQTIRDENLEEESESMEAEPSETAKAIGSRSKRSRRDLDSSWDDREMKEYLVDSNYLTEEAKVLETEIKSILDGDGSRRMSKENTTILMSKVSMLSKRLTQVANKNVYLAGVLEGMRVERQGISHKIDTAVSEKQSGPITFAGVTAGPALRREMFPSLTGMTRRIPQLAQVAVIKPPVSLKAEKSEETKRKVMEMMEPAKNKLRIKGIRLRRDGGLVIEAASAADLGKIIEDKN